MRIFLLLAGIVLTTVSMAQKAETRLLLKKGQQIIAKTTVTGDADMGMGMEMKNFTSSAYNLRVLETEGSSYTVSRTLTGTKISMDFMGQSTSYDSDNKEDSASDIGKSLSTLNVPDTVTIDKYTAVVSLKKKSDTASDGSNPMESMFESLSNNNEQVIYEAFLVIPAGSKVGDKWTDSSSNESTKTIKEYQLKSVENGLAAVSIDSRVETNTQTEMQGMQINISMSTKSSGEIIVDPKTSLVKKRSTKAVVNGTLDMMGQTMNVSGNVSTNTLFEQQ